MLAIRPRPRPQPPAFEAGISVPLSLWTAGEVTTLRATFLRDTKRVCVELLAAYAAALHLQHSLHWGHSDAMRPAPPAVAAAGAKALAWHGVAMLLGGCVWGALMPLLQVGHLLPCERAAIGAHSLFFATGTVAIALAAIRAYTPPISPTTQWWLHFFTVVGLWLNPISYLLTAVSGEATIASSILTASFVGGQPGCNGKGPLSVVILAMLLLLSACNLVAFSAWLWLLRGKP